MTLPASLKLSDGTVYRKVNTPPLWRVLHDRELPSGVRDKVTSTGKTMPEVFPLLPNQFTTLNYAWQWFWKNINPNMSKEDWTKLLGYQRAFTNNNGFGMDDPRVNYVTGENLGAEPPKIESLLCGGALITGEPDVLYKGEKHLRVLTLDGKQSPPPVEWVVARPWFYFEAVSVRPDGATQSFSLTSYPEYVPIVASILPVYFPMSGLVKV